MTHHVPDSVLALAHSRESRREQAVILASEDDARRLRAGMSIAFLQWSIPGKQTSKRSSKKRTTQRSTHLPGKKRTEKKTSAKPIRASSFPLLACTDQLQCWWNDQSKNRVTRRRLLASTLLKSADSKRMCLQCSHRDNRGKASRPVRKACAQKVAVLFSRPMLENQHPPQFFICCRHHKPHGDKESKNTSVLLIGAPVVRTLLVGR